MTVKTKLGSKLLDISKNAKANQVKEQVESFRKWVAEELADKLTDVAKKGKYEAQFNMEDFYFNGVNTHDQMIHYLKDFCKREELHYHIMGGKTLVISWWKK